MVLAFYFPAGVQAADSAQECGQSEQEGVPANKLVSLEPERSFFLVTQGKGEGRRIEMTIRPLEDSKKRHILTFKDLYRLNITQESDGSVHGQCLELIEKNKRITFKPDLELIPPVLAVDQQIRATGKAAIYDMESGEQTNTGDYCYVIKELSRTTFDTPGGPIKGYLLEYAFEIDLPYSNILLDLENGWSENRQLVYWRTKTTVEKLGLFGKTTFRSLSLAKDQPE
ncbi:MAG: hypothetical protein ACLFRF_09065 [Desulfobacterales bacterium]